MALLASELRYSIDERELSVQRLVMNTKVDREREIPCERSSVSDAVMPFYQQLRSIAQTGGEREIATLQFKRWIEHAAELPGKACF